MRKTVTARYLTPKNTGVAPRFDTWNEKYEPWEHMKRMGRLAGTGFYIPPDWYNHFRMFPPINHNFQQEQTLNPMNESEPTQDGTDHLSAERIAIRDELARKSRLVASEGMRYYNIFWVRKPLDRMEKEYYQLTRNGVQHDEAIKRVLQGFYEELTAKKRVAAIQAEEAKLSGKFITMREATVVMNVLTQLQREQLTPHQATLLAKEQRERVQEAAPLRATVSRGLTKDGAAQSSRDGESVMSADALADLLSTEDEGGDASKTSYKVTVESVGYDNQATLDMMATDGTDESDWYSAASGEAPFAGVQPIKKKKTA